MRIVLRFRQRATRTSRFLTGSLAVHAALVALLLALPGFARKPPIPEDALVVELAGGLPAPRASAPAARAVQAAPPAPKPPPEGPSVVKEVPPPAKKPKEPEKKKLPEKTPEPKPIGPAEPAGPPAEGPGGPAGASAFPEAAGTGITALGSGDPALAGYYARISALLNGRWIRPVLLDETRGARSVVVSFEIARNGNVFNLEVDEPSGLDVLDRSALRAVLDSSPLPPAPGGWRGASVPVRVRFVLDPNVP